MRTRSIILAAQERKHSDIFTFRAKKISFFFSSTDRHRCCHPPGLSPWASGQGCDWQRSGPSAGSPTGPRWQRWRWGRSAGGPWGSWPFCICRRDDTPRRHCELKGQHGAGPLAPPAAASIVLFSGGVGGWKNAFNYSLHRIRSCFLFFLRNWFSYQREMRQLKESAHALSTHYH